MQLFALGGCKALLCDFLIECWAALGFSHEGRISACDFGDFPGVDFLSVSGIINA